MERPVALQLKNISKYFGSVVANKDINLTLYKGEILSLLGENGSGKTTLMNMISGIYFPDEGEIEVNGQHVSIRSPKDAFDLKIGMIHQHFKLVDLFTAGENIALGVKDKKFYNIKRINAEVQEIVDKYGFELDVKKKIYDMSVSEKQTVEIVKVLYRGADILILDEPTAVLTPQEVDKLFAVLRKMREDGKSVIIITHKLNEVLEISDRVSILRKGRYIGTVNTKETSVSQLTEMMVGEKVTLNIDRPKTEFDHPLLEIRDLVVKNDEGTVAIDHLNFFIRGGEILGVAGIAGCGQKELCEAIAGLRKVAEGGIYREGKNIVGMTPKEINDLGIAMSFIPEDRLGMGLAPSMSITENMMLKNYSDARWHIRRPVEKETDSERTKEWKRYANKRADFWEGTRRFIDSKKARAEAEKVIADLGVVTPSTETPVRRLSGGNVQKILLGREILINPNVLVTAYPVRGLDINSSYLIYDILNKQKKDGTGILFIGEDLDVMLALCDKIMVICHGKLMGVVHAEKTTKEELGLMMTGALNLMDEKGKVMGIAKDTLVTEEKKDGDHE